MKKIIMSLVIGGLAISTASAAEYMNIVKIQGEASTTRVSFVRGRDDSVLMTGDYIFQGKSNTAQELVNKVAMRCDNNIITMTKLASTTAVKGLIGDFAMARYEAFQKKGLTGYLVELARQIDLME